MSALINNNITTAGLLALAKGALGEPIKYTKIVLGDGYLPDGQSIRTLHDVVNPKAILDISKLQIRADGKVIVGGVFNNAQLNTGFFYRELGLYAEDPDNGEILYCYGNCEDLAEWIPPTGGSDVIEKTIDIITTVGSATKVSAYISADAYATKEDYEKYIDAVNDAVNKADTAANLSLDAYNLASSAQFTVIDINSNVISNNSKIATLWDAVFSEITSNPFQITFANLDGITLSSGVWNATYNRLEC